MSSDLKTVLGSYSAATKNVRKSIDAVIDPRSFVEFDSLIGSAFELGEAKGEGVLCGLASVGDHDVALFANNPDVFEGGISAKGAKKICRLIDRAMDAGIPLIAVLDTAGSRVLEGVDALEGYGEILDGFAQACGSIPVITVVKGKDYGMLAYLAGLSDLFIAYDKAKVATTSPLVLSASADGKEHSDAKTHYEQSGAVTNIVKSDAELRELLVRVLDEISDTEIMSSDDANRVCKELKNGSGVRDVLASAFDAGSVIELRGGVAPNVVTALARLDGVSVAVVGVDGRLTARGAAKVTDMLNTADALGLPVIDLVNSEGVVVDAHQETHCLIRNVGDLIYAYGNVSVPVISLVCGKAVGAAYTIFASKRMCKYSMAWDEAEIAPLESTSAARLVYGDEIAKAKDPDAAEAKFAKAYGVENSALVAAEKGCLDTVLLPAHTRQYLIASLRTVIKR